MQSIRAALAKKLSVLAMLTMTPWLVYAEDVEGPVEAVDAAAGTITIQGTTIHVTDTTRFEDGLTSLASIKEGERIEVDYIREGNRLIATEVERDD